MPRKPFQFDYELVQRLAGLGISQKDISAAIGITEQTFQKHLHADILLQEAVSQGKLNPVRKVEEALFKKAIGYATEEVKMIGGIPIEKKIKQVVPSDTAIKFFLKNHCPERYKDEFKIGLDLAGQMGNAMGKVRG